LTPRGGGKGKVWSYGSSILGEKAREGNSLLHEAEEHSLVVKGGVVGGEIV